jgi:hypothetical protein
MTGMSTVYGIPKKLAAATSNKIARIGANFAAYTTPSRNSANTPPLARFAPLEPSRIAISVPITAS